MTMDAAARAELDALRVRAYGPSPDIANDPAALERLAALEDLALPAPPTPSAPALEARAADAWAAGDPETEQREGAAPDDAPAAEDARIVDIVPARADRRPRWHTALVAAVAIVGVVLGATAAPQSGLGPASDPVTAGPAGGIPAVVREATAFVGSPTSEVLIQVRIDGSFGDYVDITATGIPLFPVKGPVTWAEPLGDYYGWRVWIGGAQGPDGNENCLLLDGEGTRRADCVPSGLKAQGALLISVPYDGVPADERPPQMSADQSLGFWWGPDGIVTILLGPTAVDPADTARLLDTGRPKAQGARDPLASAVIPVLRDADTGVFVDLSALRDAPKLPASEKMTWAQPLGEHFGWELWIGSVPTRRGDEFCILLAADSLTRSRCASAESDLERDLVVSLPYALIGEGERPPEMTAGQSVEFVWDRADAVTVRVAAG